MADYREANDILKAQLKDKGKQLNEMEQLYADQINIAAEELDNINEEMESRKRQMDASNEQLIMKVHMVSTFGAFLISLRIEPFLSYGEESCCKHRYGKRKIRHK